MKDFCGLEGNVTLKIFDSITDELLETFEGHNLIVAAGLTKMWSGLASLEFNAYQHYFHSVRFNFSNTAEPAWGDEDIVGGWTEKLLTACNAFVGTTPQAGSGVTCYFELLAGEGNGKTINELSLWLVKDYADSEIPDEMYLFSRIKRANIVKTSAIRIEGTWEIRSRVAV